MQGRKRGGGGKNGEEMLEYLIILMIDEYCEGMFASIVLY